MTSYIGDQRISEIQKHETPFFTYRPAPLFLRGRSFTPEKWRGLPHPTQRGASRHGVRVLPKCPSLSMPAASRFLRDVMREECAEETVTTVSFPERWDSSGKDGDR